MGCITDVDSKSVYDVDIDFEALLSSSQNRANLIANLCSRQIHTAWMALI